MSHFPTHGKIRNPVNARVPAYPVPCWPRNPAPRSRHRLTLEFLQQPPNADWRSGCELPIKRWVSIFPWRRAHCRCVTLSKIKCGDPDLSITVLKQGQSCLFSIQYFWRPGVSPLNSAFPFKNQIFPDHFHTLVLHAPGGWRTHTARGVSSGFNFYWGLILLFRNTFSWVGPFLLTR